MKSSKKQKCSLIDLLQITLNIDTPDFKRSVTIQKQSGFDVALIKTRLGNVYAIAIIAPAAKFNSAEHFLKTVLDKSPSAGIGIVADVENRECRFIRRKFSRSEFEYLHEYRFDGAGISLSETNWVYANNTSSSNHYLSLLSDKVESVFFEIHSCFRDIDGLHADEALDELCKVLYTKLYDEEHTRLKTVFRMQRRLYLNIDECAADIRSLYFEAAEYDSRIYEMKIPGYARSRGVFANSIRLSNAALVRAVEILQGYHLGNSGFDIKGRAFQKVIGPAMRSGMGQYFTPLPVIEFLTAIMQPNVRELILDPFCGSAHFLTSSLEFVRKAYGRTDKIFHEFAFGKLHGMEKSDRMVRVAMTDMRLHGDGHSNIRCVDSLLSFNNYPDLKPDSFDLILTNPPFGSTLSSEALDQLGQFDLTKGRNSLPLEILGLERSIQLLRPGGRMGIVLPDGITANRNTQYVREWLEKKVKIRGIISLPIETFVPYGASIKTCILIVRKWEVGEYDDSDYPVFLARIDNVGYDATGKSKSGSDLGDSVKEFSSFIDQNGW